MSIEHRSTIAAAPSEVWAWQARPGALQRLLPPWMPGRVRREADSLADGVAVIDGPGGLRWVARHDPAGYEPGRAFVDELDRDGLASLPADMVLDWRHTHIVEPAPNGARVIERVETGLGSRVLRPMFVFRHRQLAEDLAAHRIAADLGVRGLTVAMTGASGLVGTALAAFLTTGGHRVVKLERGDRGRARAEHDEDVRFWDPEAPAADLLVGVDAVVHLAGASIFGRFTDAHKGEVVASRLGPTRELAALAAATEGVRTFVSASAIGAYGPERGDERLTESSALGTGFLAELVAEWEAAAREAEVSGTRSVQVRTGIVQSPRGGTLQIFRPLYSAGLGGPLGDGAQWQSWIDVDDLVDVYHRALVDDRLSGPVNAVAPEPVRQRDYAETLGRVLRRPAALPTPSFAPRVLLGTEGSRELANADQRVVPTALEAVGHRFRRPGLEASLRHQLGRPHLD